MKRDCNKFSRVGDILMTVPLSMPAKVDYNAAISYFVRSAQSTGQYAQILKQVGLTVANLASQKCQLTLIYSMRTQSRLSPVLQPHAAHGSLLFLSHAAELRITQHSTYPPLMQVTKIYTMSEA